ncbi:hypothetical protein GHT09_009644 [Marmota monax]|uniref:Uncharacterized protein n=1 Tax=Marmota monax TaxID=9995 RepID=A0A834V0Y6_MARMO|nr:hypothetical protein GHT09_009644 [Marmota monax]
MGSLFRSGFRPTLFSSQLMRYADLYTATCLNVLRFPLNLLFRAVLELMPHETIMEQEQASLDPASCLLSCRQRVSCPGEEKANCTVSLELYTASSSQLSTAEQKLSAEISAPHPTVFT